MQRSRPRFKKDLDIEANAFIDSFKEAINGTEKFSGSCEKSCLQVWVQAKENRFYSPRLELQVIAQEKGCTVRGLYGPEASIWLLWACGYGIGIIIFFISATFGFVQMSLDIKPWGLWGVPVAIILALCLYSTSLIGQKLGKEQIDLLNKFTDSLIPNSSHKKNSEVL